LLIAAFSGCQYLEPVRSLPSAAVGDHIGAPKPADAAPVQPGPGAVSSALPEDADRSFQAESGFYRPGSGVFVNLTRPPAAAATAKGDVTLNFENTNLLEVVKVILADLLGVNYVVDPGVQGSVTLQTSQPLPRESLISTLELLLRMNGAALVQRGGVYHVVPKEGAISGLASPQLGTSAAPLPRGFSVRIVPLRFIAASEMQKILEPFVTQGNVVRVDPYRNLLILAGSGQEMAVMLETVTVFDVDWLAGMSVALFTPSYVDAASLASDLENIFGTAAGGPLTDLVKLTVIERLDALLVISPREEYLNRVANWVEQLDQDSGSEGQRLYVYQVQNGKAVDLADVLNQVFETGDAAFVPPPELAPGLEPVAISSQAPEPGQPVQEGAAEPSPPAGVRRAAVIGPRGGVAIFQGSDIRIIADEVNNALLIMATANEYRQVRSALKQLDIVPLQVLIEATIAEVSLEDDLRYGIEWFFKNKVGDKKGIGTLDLGTAGLAALTPGFSYAITSAGAVRAVLNALATDSKLKVISSPSLMVLNNQTATIEVGDQVPITTQQQQSTSTTANIINSIEYRDTGVLLDVTPRVNAGGLVTMEISQEVSDVAPNPADPLTPTIQQRRINSTVAIQSGETVVLGGLIRENDSQTQTGIPGLNKLPIVGFLFGATSDERKRTELVVLITPRAVQGAMESRTITNEFRATMDSLKPSAPPMMKDLKLELAPSATE
jgi:general secretion pathway protein D